MSWICLKPIRLGVETECFMLLCVGISRGSGRMQRCGFARPCPAPLATPRNSHTSARGEAAERMLPEVYQTLRRCVKAARRCPTEAKRREMLHYIRLRFEDGKGERDAWRVERLLREANEEAENMEAYHEAREGSSRPAASPAPASPPTWSLRLQAHDTTNAMHGIRTLLPDYLHDSVQACTLHASQGVLEVTLAWEEASRDRFLRDLGGRYLLVRAGEGAR